MKRNILLGLSAVALALICLTLFKCSSNSLYNGASISAPGKYVWESGEPGPATCQALVQNFNSGDQVTVQAKSSAGCPMAVYGANDNSPVMVISPGTTGTMTFNGSDFQAN